MAAIRYTAEEKARALALSEQIGVVRASAELGITTTSLYKWRNERAEPEEKGSGAMEPSEPVQAKIDASLQAKCDRLEREIESLRATIDWQAKEIDRLTQTNARMMTALTAVIQQ